jgi:membrane protease YdiL (CAAX protease family)
VVARAAFDRLTMATAWLTARTEILVPVLGLPLFLMLLRSNQRQRSPALVGLGWGLAITYAGLVIWSPMGLPAKAPQQLNRTGFRRTAVMVVLIVVGAVVAQTALRVAFGAPPPSRNSPVASGLLFALIIGLGTAGIVAERALPIDLFPVIRRRQARRILYVIVAALFLTLLEQIWSDIFGGIASSIGTALGEAVPGDRLPSQIDASQPIYLFFYFLIGAGIFEELLFRVGIMTTVWRLSGRWLWGLLVSALLFGVYHITLSGFSDYFMQAPATAVLNSIGAGLATGVIYRYRGFTTAVMAHTLGNWLLVMIMA